MPVQSGRDQDVVSDIGGDSSARSAITLSGLLSWMVPREKSARFFVLQYRKI